MFENIMQAFQGLRSHKLRSFLTMLGIIIGIASIITIVATIRGTSEQIKQNLIGAGNNVVTVQLYQQDMAYDMMYYGNPMGVSTIEAQQVEQMQKLDGVQEVTLFRKRDYTYNTYYQNTLFSGGIYGIEQNYFSLYGYQVKLGRSFTDADYSSVRKVAILDEKAAKNIFGTQNPIGEILEIEQVTFTVIGVVALQSAFEPTINSVEDYYTYADTSSGKIFISSEAWPVVYRFDEPQSVAVRANSTDEMTNAGKAVADYLTENQIAEKVSNDYAYRSNDLLERAEQLQNVSNSTSQQLIWIAGISLLVGGVGVMNIMLVTVTERTSEIGLRKALGAKRRRILGQFLTEAAVLTGIGGVLGALGGIGLAELISRFMDTPTLLSIPAVLIAVIFSVLIGLIFGLIPAVKASKLNPIEALRRD